MILVIGALLPSITPVCSLAQMAKPPDATQMTMPKSQDSEQRAKYTCPAVNDDAAKAKTAAMLSQRTSDKNSLACAADMRAELASRRPRTLSADVDALASLLAYINAVRDLKRYDLLQIDWDEFDIRLEHAATLAGQLIPAARQAWPKDSRIIILSAAVDASLAGPNDPAKVLAAIDDWKRVISQDPRALGGLAQLLVGRSYQELAPVFGGGVAKAIPYLTQAQPLSPGDPRPPRYLTEAYDELGRQREAVASLATLVNIKPGSVDAQLLADEWRMGEGLATRIQAPELADKFATQRAALMRQHPEVLSRKIEAALGHGGDNPMTGKPQYAGEQH
jgi:hypothetical protein